MGNAKSVPVIGETVTAIESSYKRSAARKYEENGDYEAAEKLRESARDAWKDYSERNLIAGSANVIYRLATLNPGEAFRVGGKMTSSFGKFTDCVPGVGHVKGTFHYALGNTKKGDDCFNKATRSATVAGSAIANAFRVSNDSEELCTEDDVAASSSAGYAYDSKKSADLGKDVGSVRALRKAMKSKNPISRVNVQLGQLGDKWGAPGTDVFYEDESESESESESD